MTDEEMHKLFIQMRRLFNAGYTRRFGARDWKDLFESWMGIFGGEDARRVWAGVRRYAHDGGRFFPYPAEVSDAMPVEYCDEKKIDGVFFRTVGQDREYNRNHKRR